ncbi:hypothetical protein AB6D11_00705 [Vibrio splendidus]
MKFGLQHAKCYEQEMAELKEQEAANARAYKAQQQKSARILSRLKRTLKPKVMQAIMWEIDAHRCEGLTLVDSSQVKGEKRTGRDYFGTSTAIRHVFEDVSLCSYSDSYGGEVFIRVRNNLYLRICVFG